MNKAGGRKSIRTQPQAYNLGVIVTLHLECKLYQARDHLTDVDFCDSYMTSTHGFY